MKETKITVSTPSWFWDFIIATGVVLVCLKLCGFIDADWVYVLIPIWIVVAALAMYATIILFAISMALLAIGVAKFFLWWKGKKL